MGTWRTSHWRPSRSPAQAAPIHSTNLAGLSPYRRENVLRLGDYTTDQLHIAPPAYNPTLRGTAEQAGQGNEAPHEAP
ncbi:hypothetical protein GCM10023178_03110 [Actinomadura luteofluorescens]